MTPREGTAQDGLARPTIRAMTDTRELLEKSAVFAHLSREQLARVEALGRRVSFQEGQLLLEEDTAGDGCFFLLEGRLEVEVRSPFAGRPPQRLATVHPGELVGELSLVDGHLRSASVRALEAGEALELSNEALLGLLEREPEIGYRVMKNLAHQLAQRIRSTNMKLRNALMDVLYY